MSRESELTVLQGMKQKILSIYEIIDRCKNTQSEYAQLQAERENNTRPALDLPRPNKKSTLEKKYTDLWRQSHLNNDRIQLFFVIAGAALILAYIVLLGFDDFGGTSFFIKPEKVFKPQSAEQYVAKIIEFCLIIAMPVALAVLLPLIFFLQETKPIIIVGAIALFFTIMSYFIEGAYTLLPLILFALTVACCAFIPMIRKAMANHPVFTAQQQQELAEAEQQDQDIIADNKQKNEQADREWAEKRAKRLPELDIEQRRLAEQFEQLKTELDEENAALEAMKGLGRDEKQLNIIDSLIYFIETCRADSIKEALHEYDKMVANQQLLELQRQRNKLEEQRIANEAADRKKQLQLLEQQEAARAREAYDSARARQEMISAVRSIEWYHWAEFNGLNK